MLAKKIALGFGIAIVFPAMIHNAVSSFYPVPDRSDYGISNYYDRHKRATKEEQIALEKQKDRLDAEYNKDYKTYKMRLFKVAVPTGILALIVGSIIPIQAMGSGLMFGGVFLSVDGFVFCWSELEYWMRFAAFSIIFVVLILIGYFRLKKQIQS